MVQSPMSLWEEMLFPPAPLTHPSGFALCFHSVSWVFRSYPPRENVAAGFFLVLIILRVVLDFKGFPHLLIPAHAL